MLEFKGSMSQYKNREEWLEAKAELYQEAYRELYFLVLSFSEDFTQENVDE